MARGTADRGVNTAHRTRTAHGAEGGPVRPVHRAFQHSMLRRCFNHDYRDPFFYMITITTHQRRPWFGVCENNACTLSADGLLVRDLWYRIPHDYPPSYLILSRSVATAHGGATPLTRETCLALNAAGAHIAEADTMEVIGKR